MLRLSEFHHRELRRLSNLQRRETPLYCDLFLRQFSATDALYFWFLMTCLQHNYAPFVLYLHHTVVWIYRTLTKKMNSIVFHSTKISILDASETCCIGQCFYFVVYRFELREIGKIAKFRIFSSLYLIILQVRQEFVPIWWNIRFWDFFFVLQGVTKVRCQGQKSSNFTTQ